MRLIDADELVKDLGFLYTKNRVPVDEEARSVLTTIMEQSTAYDVDKVVGEIAKDKSVRFTDSFDSNTYTISLMRAIEIVKRGGENE